MRGGWTRSRRLKGSNEKHDGEPSGMSRWVTRIIRAGSVDVGSRLNFATGKLVATVSSGGLAQWRGSRVVFDVTEKAVPGFGIGGHGRGGFFEFVQQGRGGRDGRSAGA